MLYLLAVLADKIGLKKMLILEWYLSIVYLMRFNHNCYVFFGLLLFTESMQQVKESPKHGSAIFQKKRYSDRYGNYSAKAFHWPVPWGLIYQFGADVILMTTAFVSILIGLYFIFHDYRKKHNLNTYALITLCVINHRL
jgi:hypothetical protein